MKPLVRTHPPVTATSLNWCEGSNPPTTKLHLSMGACALHTVPGSVGVLRLIMLVGGVAIVTRGDGRLVMTIVLTVRGRGTLTKLRLFDT